MTLDNQRYIDKIHEEGVKLFGSGYNKTKSESRIREWLQKDKNKTVEGIYKTIHWWFDICQKSTEKSNNGFGIVPYIYYEAMSYYDEIKKAQKEIIETGAVQDAINREEESVRVRIPQYKPKSYLKGFELS